VQLSAAHRPEHVDRAVLAFTKVGKSLGVLGGLRVRPTPT
jgi:hypothetical protein